MSTLNRYTFWSSQDLAAAVNSDVIWVDGDDFSVQVYSEIGTRAGTLYIDITNDGTGTEGAKIWTTAAPITVTNGVLLNHVESVINQIAAGVRLRWEPSGGAGTMTRANVCVKALAKEE